ncbi:tetratricopeptide repeat protein [Candidatus Woesearchaeota archaeon]|nr:tetratricopeptide repeat protein [Candidatus Woesearchaeota archaeon]
MEDQSQFPIEMIIADVTRAINSVKDRSGERDEEESLSLALDLLQDRIETGDYASKLEYFVRTERSRLERERVLWNREMEAVDVSSWDKDIRGREQLEEALSKIQKDIGGLSNLNDNPSRYADLLNKSGDLLIRLGRSDEGIRAIIKSVDLNPHYKDNSSRKFNAIGSAYARADRWSEAIEYFRKSIEDKIKIPLPKMFDPDYFMREDVITKTASEDVAAQFQMLGATLDAELGNYVEAIKMYETAIRLCPINDYKYSLHFSAGSCYGLLANFTKAIFHLGEGIKNAPEVLYQYPYFAVALADIGRAEEGIKLLRKLE